MAAKCPLDKRRAVASAILAAIAIAFIFAGCSSNGADSQQAEELKEGSALLSGSIATENNVQVDYSESNVLITAQRSTGETYQTNVDSTGSFSMAVPIGEYLVEADGGYMRKALIKAEVGENGVRLNITLTPTGTITGALKYEEERISTSVFILGTSYLALADNDGNFKMTNIPVGDYELTVGMYGVIPLHVEMGENDLGSISMSEQEPTVSFSNNKSYSPDGTELIIPPSNLTNGISVNFTMEVDKSSAAKEIKASVKSQAGSRELEGFAIKWQENPYHYYPLAGANAKLTGLDALLAPGDLATVTVGSGLMGANGQTMTKSKSFSFLVEDIVTHLWPKNGDIGVRMQRGSGIQLAFSAAVEPSSLSLEITPEVSGGIEIIQSSPFAFEVLGAFENNEAYNLKILSAATIKGRSIYALPRSTTFTAAGPAIASTIPTNNARDVNPSSPVQIFFNSVMDRDSVEAGIVVRATSPGREKTITSSEMTFIWDEFYTTTLYDFSSPQLFGLDFPMNYATEYEVSATGAKTYDGEALADFFLKFKTAAPRLALSSPTNNSTRESVDFVNLVFNAALKAQPNKFLLIDEEENIVAAEIKFGPATENPSPHQIPPYEEFDADSCQDSCHGEWWVGADQLQGRTLGRIAGVQNMSAWRNVLIVPTEPLPAGGSYTARWSEIEAADGTPVADGEITFHTEETKITRSNPIHGSVSQGLEHRMEFWFNDVLSAEEERFLESAFRVNSNPPAWDEKDPSRPKFQFLWSDGGDGARTKLIVNWTFEPGTNYTAYFDGGDGAATKGTLIDPDTGEKVLHGVAPIVFSTEGERFAGWEIYLLQVDECSLTKNNRIHPDNSVKLVFGTDVAALGDSVALTDSEGMDIPLTDARFYSSNFYSNQCSSFEKYGYTCSQWTISELPLAYNETYTLTIANDISLKHSSDPETFNNIPHSFTFETKGPRAGWNINNERGVVTFSSNEYNICAMAEDLANAFSSTPDLTDSDVAGGIWDFMEWDEDLGLYLVPEKCVEEATLYFRPRQYANIQLRIAEIEAQSPKQQVDPDTRLPLRDEAGNFIYEYQSVGPFEGTPFNEVFSVDPNIEPPTLEHATAENLNLVNLSFNAKLDAFSALDTANYKVIQVDENGIPTTDSQGNTITLQIVKVLNDANVERPLDPTLLPSGDNHVGPNGLALLTSPQALGAYYKVEVSGVYDWGGHYEIKPEEGYSFFPAYRGSFLGYSARTRTIDDLGMIEVLVRFDVPMDKTSITDDSFVLFEEKYTNGKWEHLRLADVSIEWNDEGSAFVLRRAWNDSQEEIMIYNLEIIAREGAKNAVGATIAIESPGELRSISEDRGMSVYLRDDDAFNVDQPWIEYEFNPRHYEKTIDPEQAATPSNYSFKESSSGAALPDVERVEINEEEPNIVRLYLASAFPEVRSNLRITMTVKNIEHTGSVWAGAGFSIPDIVKQDFLYWPY